MSETQSPLPELPRAELHPRRFSPIWLIPIAAVAIASWLGWQTLRSRGESITITFDTADGLAAGRTPVSHKAVELGRVQRIELTNDLKRVIVHVQMQRDADRALTDHARFWVVRPRLTPGNISGLETIVSGAYIEMDPGAPGGQPTTTFQGLPQPPGVRSDEPGRTITLKAGRLGAVGQGSPMFYHDVQVGEVLNANPTADGNSFTLQAYIRQPYDKWVHRETRFWNASGLTLSTGGAGIQLQLESLQAVLSGGVAFDNDPSDENTPPSPNGEVFTLYPNQDAAAADIAASRQVNFVAYFTNAVRGIAAGSPVQLYGQRIGTVTGLHLERDPVTGFRVPIHFTLDRTQLALAGHTPDEIETESLVRGLLAKGLHAELQSLNLVTGQQALGLVFDPHSTDTAFTKEDDVIVLPAQGGGLEDLTQSASDILRKVNALPFAEIGESLQDTLGSVSKLATGPDLKQALQSLSATLASVQQLVQKADTGLSPALKRLPEIASNLQETTARADRLVGSVDSGYGANSNFSRNLGRLLDQVTEAARTIRELADFLDRHPEALVRGRTGSVSDK